MHINTITVKTLARRLNVSKETLIHMCKEGRIKGAVFNDNTKTFHISVNTSIHLHGARR